VSNRQPGTAASVGFLQQGDMMENQNFEITSEMLEPCFGQVLARTTLKTVATIKEHGPDSHEADREQLNWEYAVDGMRKIAHAAEGAVHARLALTNEIQAARRLINNALGRDNVL
jgi:hypothetical protein